jgi:hypothetical protein
MGPYESSGFHSLLETSAMPLVSIRSFVCVQCLKSLLSSFVLHLSLHHRVSACYTSSGLMTRALSIIQRKRTTFVLTQAVGTAE